MVRFVRFISALFRFGTGKAKSESSSAAIVVPRSESVQEPRTLNDYVEWFERGRFGTGGGVFSRDEDRRSLGRMMNALTDSGDFRASQIQYAQGLALRVLRDRDARTAAGLLTRLRARKLQKELGQPLVDPEYGEYVDDEFLFSVKNQREEILETLRIWDLPPSYIGTTEEELASFS